MNGKYQTALVRRLSQVAAGTFQLDLETAISDHVQPGQFVLLQPLAETSLLPRPFTVYFAQQGIFIRLVFEARGSNTRLYSQLKSGDKIRVLGPCGQPAVIDDSARLAIFIGWLLQLVKRRLAYCVLLVSGIRTTSLAPRILIDSERHWK